ncbi:MAG: hypothetical protein CL755_13685 [Chloroflexi bacterium]|nr:hypothetical protein [Chloroflexota bacterium]MAX59869.1 hypothetical protein [Chloroflexota bacterium]HIB12629.1 hypothetical protein [Dehalococcoidia bacterium]
MAEVVNVRLLKAGDKLQVSHGATVVVVSNPLDGVWIFARYLASPKDPSLEGTEDMIFAQDIIEVLEISGD